MPIENVKDMKGFLRPGDWPNCYRVGDLTSPNFNLLFKEFHKYPSQRSHAQYIWRSRRV